MFDVACDQVNDLKKQRFYFNNFMIMLSLTSKLKTRLVYTRFSCLGQFLF